MLFSVLPKTEEKPCLGLIFRGYRNLFTSGLEISLRQGVKLLKRQSCTGCEQCGYLWDEIAEAIACDNLIIPEIEHGKKYSARVTNIYRDYESGHVEDYDIEIYKIEEKP